jgi:hypothetical protein
MSEIPAQLAAEQALLRQNVALSTIKQSAEQSQKIAAILEEAVESVPASPVRGTNVNITA